MFKMLLATDGSFYALQAVNFAGELARHIPDAEITVLSVVDPGIAAAGATTTSGIPVPSALTLPAELERAAEAALAQAREKLKPVGRKVHTRSEHGNPARLICKVAEEGHFDLIVLGGSGMGRVADILLGSVSSKVVHEAKVPVLIVRDKG
jgi:nucleotide-binding universal stress UspA family protein